MQQRSTKQRNQRSYKAFIKPEVVVGFNPFNINL